MNWNCVHFQSSVTVLLGIFLTMDRVSFGIPPDGDALTAVPGAFGDTSKIKSSVAIKTLFSKILEQQNNIAKQRYNQVRALVCQPANV